LRLPGLNLSQRTFFRLLLWVAACSLVVATVFLVHSRARQTALKELRTQSHQRLEVYLKSVEGELARYDYLPTVIALNTDVAAMLQYPTDPSLIGKVNDYLQLVNESARSSAVYILDLNGLTLAASNWNDPISFVGVNLAYRPYFQDASKGINGRFYAIGTTSGVPGYFRSTPITRNGQTIGVMALKVSLDALEEAWKSEGEIVSIIDRNEVVFLSAASTWKYKATGFLTPSVLEKIRASRQYEAATLDPVEITPVSDWGENGRIVKLNVISNGQAPTTTSEYLEQRRTIRETDWQLLLHSNLAPVYAFARDTAVIAAFACGIVLLVALYLHQRWQALSAEAAARLALQQAHERLEQEVAERTSELRRTNYHLEREVEERKRTESDLREAQGGLVQAGKMAALGQMSAVVTHELNQPLAALRTLSDNAKVFLKRDRLGEVENNLAIMSDTIERMGSITAQLRSFSRKVTSNFGRSSVRRAMYNALFFVEQQVRAESIILRRSFCSEELLVRCDSYRLEQVFVNLLTNAVDAVRGCQTRQIEVSIAADGGRALIRVRDSGKGIPPDLLTRLFDPFFTTKDLGAGLGLGLTIAREIVHEADGTLHAANAPGVGAEFRVELPLAPAESSDV
jgi:two-component system, NtrC family, C4-dicarboxylate transport sensor histidine kinase DctB